MALMIGRGERATRKILEMIYGSGARVLIQCPLKNLLTQQYRTGLSPRQEKETIDIALFTDTDTLAIRVQDRRHKHVYLSKIDKIQRRMLEWSGVKVIDVNEDNCPEVFKDFVNKKSFDEILKEIKNSRNTYP